MEQYFYGNVSRETAEWILTDYGCSNGLYLLRQSSDDFVLSLCHNKSVLHYRITRLSSGEVVLQGLPEKRFPSVVALIADPAPSLATKPVLPCLPTIGLCLPPTHWGLSGDEVRACIGLKAREWGIHVTLTEDLHLISTLKPLVNKTLHEIQPWFHGKLSRADAERRMTLNGHKDGKFLVRERDQQSYALCVSHEHTAKHYRIDILPSGNFAIHDGPFFEMSHYTIFANGLWCCLGEACPKQCTYQWTFERQRNILNRRVSTPTNLRIKEWFNTINHKWFRIKQQRDERTEHFRTLPHVHRHHHHQCCQFYPQLNPSRPSGYGVIRSVEEPTFGTTKQREQKLLKSSSIDTIEALLNDPIEEIRRLHLQPVPAPRGKSRAEETYANCCRCSDWTGKLDLLTGGCSELDLLREFDSFQANAVDDDSSTLTDNSSHSSHSPLIRTSLDNPIYEYDALRLESDSIDKSASIGIADLQRTKSSSRVELKDIDLICLDDEPVRTELQKYRRGPLCFDSRCINLKKRIGNGYFGDVYLASLPSSVGSPLIHLAVKMLKSHAIPQQKMEILKEAQTMASLDHKHIVRLIGVCEGEPFMLVMELAPLGPLNKYLHEFPSQSNADILRLMLQVAKGMKYLEERNFVHRDLAARNVLLVNERFAKISDFGMSRALGLGKEYYRARSASKWPLKWYAPECIYYYRFSSKSDVWSYGVTLWEALSRGEMPYQGMDGTDILRMFQENRRLPKPDHCPAPIYQIMWNCWHFRPDERLNFGEICETISHFLGHN